MNGSAQTQPPPPEVTLQLLIVQALQLSLQMSAHVLTGKFEAGNFEIEIRQRVIVTPPHGGGPRLVQG